MVAKSYDWANGAELGEHSRRKLQILREYFANYLEVRCQFPHQSRFRLAVIDGFAGGGRYKCGTGGSPVVFLEGLKEASQLINIKRQSRGLDKLEIECLLVFNDFDRVAIEILRERLTPLLGGIKASTPQLHLRVEYLNYKFKDAFSEVRRFLSAGRYRNVLVNLDQSGHSHIHRDTIVDILHTYPSVEVFFTFAIEALVSFMRKSEPTIVKAQLAKFGIGDDALDDLDRVVNREAWLGAAECLVSEAFRTYASFVSPFSINNPDGWRYWLVHFANSYRARQVYNNILHDNSSAQAHFGRSGLRMLHYDPKHERGGLYLFDNPGREVSRTQLIEDIPRLISDSGDAMAMADFYQGIYNETPAHADDIHAALLANPDIAIITPRGGERRKASAIAVNDILKLRNQRSFPRFLWDKPGTPKSSDIPGTLGR